ncbi:metal ABC transporter ATP-binding protein [Alkalicoccus daliensis]|uniref:Iron/zinc/copper transport system ATP-binding protein n=1 Tax=Alkalicoccus daliensis TaxID=745820 RepID=A0A1H0BAY0_9BACI|nr:metal ABC transporter ATP-binding protein [Alkalicoccus daliensis]SDN42768.1 iron/zinc/copper transport system ATP-binding protein [Alkalicoccus daliensis]
MKKTIEVKNLSVHYYGDIALENVSFSMNEGNIIGVVGPNGAGKSTLMKALLGLVKFDGEVSIFGQRVNELRKNIAYVPQRSTIDWDFPILVEDAVLMGRYMHIPWYKKTAKKDREKAEKALEQVGMESFRKKQIGELSGGQQQRVFIARALAQDADLFFLDEPFVGIDVNSEEIIVNLLKQLREQGKTIFVIHHDLSKVETYFDELLMLNQRLIGAGPVKEIFNPQILKQAYGGNAAVISSDKEMVVVGP